jgi:hypothetical protein
VRWRSYLLLRTWRDLRLSAARGRPIALPNLLRLHQRRLCRAGVDPLTLTADDPISPKQLAEHYRRLQPMRRGRRLPRPTVLSI